MIKNRIAIDRSRNRPANSGITEIEYVANLYGIIERIGN